MLLGLRSREELLDDVGLSSLQEEVDLVARYASYVLPTVRLMELEERFEIFCEVRGGLEIVGGTSRGKSEVFREATLLVADIVVHTIPLSFRLVQ